MTTAEAIQVAPCPARRDRQHAAGAWLDEATGRCGLSCRHCHKTWELISTGALVPTYPEATP